MTPTEAVPAFIPAAEEEVMEEFLRSLYSAGRHGCGYGMTERFERIERFVLEGNTRVFYTAAFREQLREHFKQYEYWRSGCAVGELPVEERRFVIGLMRFMRTERKKGMTLYRAFVERLEEMGSRQRCTERAQWIKEELIEEVMRPWRMAVQIVAEDW